MFVLRDDKTLVEMKPAHFAAESDFQQLLSDYPDLLAGSQIDSESPRRWLLVKRESPIPSEEGGSGRWFVDHLFLDQDGIPTFVEVKRQSDTRIRREVIGQMLDYAANSVVNLRVGEMKSSFEENCAARGVDPLEILAKLLGQETTDAELDDTNAEAFWARVKTNLQAGKVRMLFVADSIPSELRRVVEFLNEQMDPAEVLALELKQYEGEGGLKTLVPKLYGQTEEAKQKKTSSGYNRELMRGWNKDRVYDELNQRFGPELVTVAKKLTHWMEANVANPIADTWAIGQKFNGTIGCKFQCGDVWLYPISVSSDAKVNLNFQWTNKGRFADKCLEWIRRLNSIEGIQVAENLARRPTVPLALFQDESRLQAFLGVMDWFVSELRKSCV